MSSSSLRDNDLANIIFTDANGKSYTIKDMRDYTTLAYQLWQTYNVKNGEDLDEIAQRRDVYRQGNEDLFYRIFEFNVADLFNVQFDMDKMKSLRIPLP